MFHQPGQSALAADEEFGRRSGVWPPCAACSGRGIWTALARGGQGVTADEDVGRPAPLAAYEELRAQGDSSQDFSLVFCPRVAVN